MPISFYSPQRASHYNINDWPQHNRYRASYNESEMMKQRRAAAHELYRGHNTSAPRRRFSSEQTRVQPQWELVQAPDGRIFKVPTAERGRSCDISPKSRSRNVVRGSDGRLCVVDPQPHRYNNHERVDYTRTCNDEDFVPAPLRNPNLGASLEANPGLPVPSTNGGQVTNNVFETQHVVRDPIVVEDASDSESEDDVMNSIWRNRCPAPGESWMEPVNHLQ